MKKYLSFFRMRFSMGLQYRAAAVAGISTQFAWGFMELFVYRAFYRVDASAFPMEFSAVVNYIWLQQAFLALFMGWMIDGETIDSISTGSIAYELCRPVHIYHMWFARTAANRISQAVLRCMPVLVVAAFLPEPYGLTFPENPVTLLLFLITMTLATLVCVAIDVALYVTCFYTIAPLGIRIFYGAASELFSGHVVPLPFMPDRVRSVVEVLPFAATQNVPLRVFSNDYSGPELIQAIGLQVFWLVVLLWVGIRLSISAEKKLVIQGG